MKSKKYLIVILLLTPFIAIKAQEKKIISHDDVYPDTSKTIKKPPSNTAKPTEQIYGEILGAGLGISVMYDTRFNPGNIGWGIRAGLGITFGTTIPISLNYVFGSNNRRSFFEIGAGATGYISQAEWRLFETNQIFPHTYIAYRYQALKTANTFRVGITQTKVSSDNGYIYFLPSLGLGHIFGRRPK